MAEVRTAEVPEGLRARVDLLRRLSAARGEEAWLVGGTVRELLAGRPSLPLDVDVAVRGDYQALARSLADETRGAYVALAPAHGTARVVGADGTTYDVSGTAGRSIEDDLARRDFTINAMAVPLAALSADGTAQVVDPFGGARDLGDRTVRMISEEPLAADPLRLLRAFRFSATLGFRVDPLTLGAIRRLAHLADRPSPERTARELFIVLGTPAAAAQVREMDEIGLLDNLLPEVALMRGVTQNAYHHLDVWLHSLEALEHLEELLADLAALVGERNAERLRGFLGEQLVPDRSRSALLKFAELLHDSGKPAMRELRDGKVTFYGHTKRGAAMVRAACERLRLSARETGEAATWVERHLVPADLVRTRPLTERRCARFFRRNGESGLALLLLALADGMATRGPASDPASLERTREFVREMADAYYGWAAARITERPLVDGRELMAATGLPPGPALGRVVAAIREAQLDRRVTSRDEALAYAKDLVARAG
ncbi:MAG TPA: HD domain-containing protein [Coriobacteriia bacterium]